MITTRDEVERLIGRRHANPHSFLGAHPHPDGVILRTWRPTAQSVAVRVADKEPVPLELIHPDGIYEGLLSAAELPLQYEFEVDYGEHGSWAVKDPYSFLPTVGELDVHLVGEGRHHRLYEQLGAHVRTVDGVQGVSFALWAPSARAVSVVGDFNAWDSRLHPMRVLGSSGIWELFVPDAGPGSHYKFEIVAQSGEIRLKADPLAFAAELPPLTASVVHESEHEWGDDDWLASRRESTPLGEPVSVYEVHLASWRRNVAEDGRSLTYLELADELAAYVKDMGFTHVELLPVMAHPFSGSWGYQVTSYFAPTPLFGSPDDCKAFVDRLHQAGVGVLLDWVPAHFPRDDWALARFDGTALYEHDDPRRGAHPDWGTLIFNYGRNEVRNFLLASAVYWLREYHADGLRVDAVASMLYLDYSRKHGEWVPNQFGGREDLEAVQFLKELNELVHAEEPGVISAAEESTAWPGVSRPTYVGGLGFGFKWNMGWMHDTLGYFQQDPIYRRYHHHELTFSLVYAFSENFILPLSHDEVVHGKGSLVDKMPGDAWQKRANLRALYAYMWAHPGKKLLFMGCEFGQEREWSHERSLDWHLLENRDHAGIQSLVRDLNFAYRDEPALWELDSDGSAFWWIEANAAEDNVIAFARRDAASERFFVFVGNFSSAPRRDYRVGLPLPGRWKELLNTDSSFYGGSDVGNFGGVEADGPGWSGQPHSATVNLPPLGAVWLVPEAPVSRPPIEQESRPAQPADERRELQDTSAQASEESVVSPGAAATDKP